MYTVSGGEDGTGTLVETTVGDVVVMSTPAISSSSGLVVPVVLLDLRLLDLERATSTPKQIIELIDDSQSTGKGLQIPPK